MTTTHITNYRKQLIKTLGHDLKQPLSVIKIAAYYLKKTTYGKQQAQIEKIEQQVDILADALSELADAERVLLNQMDLQMEYFSLAEIVTAATTQFKAAKPRVLKALSTTQNYTILGDKLKSQQALLTMLHAVASLADRKGQLYLQLSPKQDQVICSISCQLFRLDEKVCAVFCQPFGLRPFQERTNSSRHLNSGLGPFIARSVLEMQQGEVLVNKLQHADGQAGITVQLVFQRG